MIYSDFQGEKLSRLGFGTMRLPLLEDGQTIDRAELRRMTRYAIEHGINYFDTAWPYHGGASEIAIGEALKEFPRESFNLATKFPGHQGKTDPSEIFEQQLKKCGVDYFDFYLLHNVNEASADMYIGHPEIIDYFLEQKRLGRIRHFGFSCHAQPDTLERFLDRYGDVLEFCQIQLNYLDWTLQNAKYKYELLTARGIPVWVMEPVRGGKLAKLGEEETAKLRALRPEEGTPAWAFRFLQGLPNVKMVLSGMSNLEQMEDNIRTFEAENPLTDEEQKALLDLAEGMKNSLPCTRCRYCCDGCPMQLDIPKLIGALNEYRFAPNNSMQISIMLEKMDENKLPSACIGCGQCTRMCPQGIDVPAAMEELADAYEKMPKWSEIVRQREEAERKLREGK